jgi:hypothetical protein
MKLYCTMSTENPDNHPLDERDEEEEAHYVPEYDCHEVFLEPQLSSENELLVVACG